MLVIAVAISFQTLNGLAAGTALLLVMGALKLFEARSRRDDGIVVGVALFLLLAAALATQSLVSVPFYLAVAWGACAAIAMIADSSGALSPRAAMRLSARALAMAIPLAIACFLFFPRVGGQFWAHAARRSRPPPAFPMKCHRAASARSPSNSIRPFACASRAGRRRVRRCTGEARC